MNRADAVAYLGPRYAAYLAAAGRTASDATGNLKEIIDDALLAMGVASADVATWSTSDPDVETDARVQLAYRLLDQVNRDLAVQFDVSIEGSGSFRLSQQRAAVEKDLQAAANAVLARFGTLDVVADDANPFTTIDLNFLEEACV